MFYAPGLLGYSAVKIASPTFYALRDSRTPVRVGRSVVSNLVLNVMLVRVIGFTWGSRSAPRSRRWSTRSRCSRCCAAGSGGSMAAALAVAPRQDHDRVGGHGRGGVGHALWSDGFPATELGRAVRVVAAIGMAIVSRWSPPPAPAD